MKLNYLKKLFCGVMFVAMSFAASSQEAQIGTTDYATLAEAFEAAAEGETITLLSDVNAVAMIPVTRNLTLELAGHTITNNVRSNRLFRLSGVTFTIEGNNGKVITPADNTKSYGFVDFRDASNVAHPGATLIASDVYFEGTTDDGGCFHIRGNDQNIEFTNVDVTLNNSRTWSIINAKAGKGVFKVKGGTYNYTSTVATTGPFQFTNDGGGSEVVLDGVTVVSNAGPIIEVVKGTATVTNCKMTSTATNSYYVACVAASNGSDITIKGGEYTSAVPVYIYNSGGTINIDGGTFNGSTAAIHVDKNIKSDDVSTVNVADGTFNGPLAVQDGAVLSLKGGNYTDKNAAEYVADGYHLEANDDGSFGVESGVVGVVDVENGDVIPSDSKVYNLQGIVVADSADGLETLPAGLYIVAGRKVVVR